MPENRKKLIKKLIGSISNAIVHEILRKAAENKEISNYYEKEIENAVYRSKEFRREINPPDSRLPEKDVYYIRNKIIKRVKTDLIVRISKGECGTLFPNQRSNKTITRHKS